MYVSTVIMSDMKNLKTYERLVNKATNGGRMPNLNKVSELLTELGIENSCYETSCEKWSSSAGYRYYTSGGSRTYTGFHFKVPEINMNIDSTDTYYSWNTWGYAKELVDLIDNHKKII